ncbi:hypothetical protein F3Y22_tig00111096pilonHSYRG00122 [Hibiscus syriacus]|uniref:Uncharacterized protein n=1 Tax=Hibiscus syriacus TaxID=106335 RepID=A0A6A2Z362_HIBSY|nr:hypothetical protein F3Y22_tig00111096pilonHSYRG00122 [Hibiscus syriacus]
MGAGVGVFLAAQLVIGEYRDRSQSHSPIRSPSPRDKRPAMSKGLKSRLGPRVDDHCSPCKDKSGSRSSRSSRGSSPSKAADISPPRDRNRRSASRDKSKSSSPLGRRGLVSYAD